MSDHLSIQELIAALVAVASVIFAIAKVAVAKTISHIEKIGDKVADVKTAIATIQVQIIELQQIKQEFRDLHKNNYESLLKIADLKKDVDAAHNGLRQLKGVER